MIAANGLFLLADQEFSLLNMTGSKYYTNAAIKILIDNTNLAWAPSWESLLANGTVNNPAHNNLPGIVYGECSVLCAGESGWGRR